jgi:tripeptide aminopeptidase
VRRAGEAERRRLNDTFAALCRIESPTGHEGACAAYVAAGLRELGLEVEEDDTTVVTGCESGNLLARIEGASGRSVMLCAHLDTVPLAAPVDPAVVDGFWVNRNDAILGADNKAAVAVMLEAARAYAGTAPEVGVELLFTVGEEDALRGAKAFDVSVLRSDFGYVFDHASPIGEVVMASPTYFRLEAEFRGVAAHAGIRPEDGRNAIAAAAHAVAAMRLGRLDADTTANVSAIAGGGATTNVVADRCRLEGECRSLDSVAAEALISELVDRCQDGANALECDVDVHIERRFEGYRTRPSAPAVQAAHDALRACGHEPSTIVTGGASDANAFEAAGFPCTNLANGTERNHQVDERVSVLALEQMLDVALALPDAVAALPGSEQA